MFRGGLGIRCVPRVSLIVRKITFPSYGVFLSNLGRWGGLLFRGGVIVYMMGLVYIYIYIEREREREIFLRTLLLQFCFRN